MKKPINFSKLFSILFLVVSFCGIGFVVVSDYISCWGYFTGTVQSLDKYQFCGLPTAVVTLPVSFSLFNGDNFGLPEIILPAMLLILACTFWTFIGFCLGSFLNFLRNVFFKKTSL